MTDYRGSGNIIARSIERKDCSVFTLGVLELSINGKITAYVLVIKSLKKKKFKKLNTSTYTAVDVSAAMTLGMSFSAIENEMMFHT